jgi:micrococcal nuclease
MLSVAVPGGADENNDNKESAYCSYVIDGDTIIVNERIKVRLIGIDTPEADKPFYKEAKEFMIQSAAKKKVLLGYDKRKKDRYGRTLAYVYMPDGTLLNGELIKKGLAEVFYKEEFRLKKDFLSLQKEAKKAKKGIWSK